VLAAIPGIAHFGSEFLAGGGTGNGEAAPGDHLQTSYHLWLFGDQIEHGGAPWRDPYQFQPEADQTVNPAVWPYGIVFWPLYHVFGIVVGWNVFTLLGFVVAGLVTLGWLRELGLSRGPALVGGLVFEIAPYRALQSHGHLLGPITVLLPLSLWALERGRRGNPAWLALSAVSIASIPLSGQVHFALGAIALYAVYALVRVPAVTRRLGLYLGAAALGVALSVAAGLLIQHVVIEGSVAANGQPLAELDRYQAQWLDFLARDPRHGSESYVFLGWVTPLAAIAGLAALLRTRRQTLALLFAAAALIPMLLALGTNTGLYRPVRGVVPGLHYARVPERLMPVACLAIAALVAFALQGLLDGELFPARRALAISATLVTAIALVVVAADLHFHALRATPADQGNKAYQALAATPADAHIVEVPVFLPDVHLGSVYQYYGTVARRRRPSGYSTTAPVIADVTARRLRPLNCGDWTFQPGRTLERLGVQEIAFHNGLFAAGSAVPGPAWFAWRGLVEHGYRPVAHDGEITILDRLHGQGPAPHSPFAEPARDTAWLCSGWYPNDGNGRAMSFHRSVLWVYGTVVRLQMRSHVALPIRFFVDGKPKLTRTVKWHVASIPVPLGKAGWHLLALDTTTLPTWNGRKEGARLLSYVLG
jgi:hypothetical protein